MNSQELGNNISEGTRFEIAWSYYRTNLDLRLRYLNFFILFSIFLTGGLFTILSSAQNKELLHGLFGAVAGALLMLFSYVFYMLDQQAAVVRRRLREIIKDMENPTKSPSVSPLFTMVEEECDSESGAQRKLIHSPLLNFIFAAFFLIGMFGVGVSVYFILRA